MNLAFRRQLVRGEPKHSQTLGHVVQRQTCILQRGHAQFLSEQDDSHPLHLKKGDPNNNGNYQAMSNMDLRRQLLNTNTDV